MNYTVVRDDHHGRHIEFAQPIHEGNFIEACTVAIALARELRDVEIAVNFWPSGLRIQVVGSDIPATQLELWKRRVAVTARKAAEPMLSVGQRVLLEVYNGGEFKHLQVIETQGALDLELKRSGDGLLRMLMTELGHGEDCDSLDEALARVDTALRDLVTVRSALAERIEDNDSCSVLAITTH